MEAGNWIALGGVAVALASNATTLWLGDRRLRFDATVSERRFDHERRLEDRRVTGEILDEAVVALRQMSYHVHNLMRLMHRRPERFYYSTIGKAAYDELARAGDILDREADRLRFRFEGGPVATAFENTMDTTGEFFSTLNLIVLEDFENADQASKADIISYCKDQADIVIELGKAFDTHFEEFRRAAFEVVGIRS